MKIRLYKYSGLGNTFVLIETQAKLCALRKWSVMAKIICNENNVDGLIVFGNSVKSFEMLTINPDGSYAALCGNAMRCSVKHFFTQHKDYSKRIFIYQQVFKNSTRSLECIGNKRGTKIEVSYQIDLDYKGPYKILNLKWFYVNSGTDHAVTFVNSIFLLNKMDILKIGRKIRYCKKYFPYGTNVDFIVKDKNLFFLRTYERGVEDETLSCATGSIAAVIASMVKSKKKHLKTRVIQKSTKILEVECKIKDNKVIIKQTGEADLIGETNYEL